jgi:hypothetical protein
MLATTMFSICSFSSTIINVTIEIQRMYLFVCKRKVLFHHKKRTRIRDDRELGSKKTVWAKAEGHETEEHFIMMGFVICTIRENTQRKLRCVVHVSCMGDMNAFSILIGIPKRKRTFG